MVMKLRIRSFFQRDYFFFNHVVGEKVWFMLEMNR